MHLLACSVKRTNCIMLLLYVVIGMVGWHSIDYAQRQSEQRLPAHVSKKTVSLPMHIHTSVCTYACTNVCKQ